MKNRGFTTAATLSIKDAPKMSCKGRERIAAWLQQRARDLKHKGDRYARRFTARYQFQTKGSAA